MSADDETTPDVEPTDGVEIDTATDDKEDSAVAEIDKAADSADSSSRGPATSPRHPADSGGFGAGSAGGRWAGRMAVLHPVPARHADRRRGRTERGQRGPGRHGGVAVVQARHPQSGLRRGQIPPHRRLPELLRPVHQAGRDAGRPDEGGDDHRSGRGRGGLRAAPELGGRAGLRQPGDHQQGTAGSGDGVQQRAGVVDQGARGLADHQVRSAAS